MSESDATSGGASSRRVSRKIEAHRTIEGGGFSVRRPFPAAALDHLDPFLLLDEMGPTDNRPGEARGAPDHPHRGFETVTYLLAGGMQHRDSAGNAGRLGPGDVQWMTAGAGVIHSELPSTEMMTAGGRMHGFQLWVNLPRKDKMTPPRYQDTPAARIPEAASAGGRVKVRVIAGTALGAQAVIETRTPILYLHFTIAPGGAVLQPVPRSFNLFAYVFAGEIVAGEGDGGVTVRDGEMAIFDATADGAALSVPVGAAGPASVLLIGGEPLREPVARYGPFVMNTRAEIVQALDDLQAGRFGEIPARP